ncbi:MAG: hypothetical protein ACLQBA_17575 [Candidatus Binataceae bacterium]
MVETPRISEFSMWSNWCGVVVISLAVLRLVRRFVRVLEILRDRAEPERQVVERHFHQVISAKAETDQPG